MGWHNYFAEVQKFLKTSFLHYLFVIFQGNIPRIRNTTHYRYPLHPRVNSVYAEAEVRTYFSSKIICLKTLFYLWFLWILKFLNFEYILSVQHFFKQQGIELCNATKKTVRMSTIKTHYFISFILFLSSSAHRQPLGGVLQKIGSAAVLRPIKKYLRKSSIFH